MVGPKHPDLLGPTRELLKVARPDEIGVSVSYPLPGTKFYDLVKAQLREKTHWRESSDLDMMFSGTYTSDFYRRVRDLMHEQVSRQGPSGELDPLVEKRWSELIACEGAYRAHTDYLPAARVLRSYAR